MIDDDATLFNFPAEPIYAKPCDNEGKYVALPNVDEAVENKPLRKPIVVEVELYPVFTVHGKAKVEPVFVMVNVGYVPVTEIPVPLFNVTVWSGAVFVIVSPEPITDCPAVTEIPVPFDIVPVATPPKVVLPLIFVKYAS